MRHGKRQRVAWAERRCSWLSRDILKQLFSAVKDLTTLKRLSARVSRLLKLLHLHQLIAKIPRSRRWRVTLKGQSIMGMVLKIHHENYPRILMNESACLVQNIYASCIEATA